MRNFKMLGVIVGLVVSINIFAGGSVEIECTSTEFGAIDKIRYVARDSKKLSFKATHKPPDGGHASSISITESKSTWSISGGTVSDQSDNGFDTTYDIDASAVTDITPSGTITIHFTVNGDKKKKDKTFTVSGSGSAIKIVDEFASNSESSTASISSANYYAKLKKSLKYKTIKRKDLSKQINEWLETNKEDGWKEALIKKAAKEALTKAITWAKDSMSDFADTVDEKATEVCESFDEAVAEAAPKYEIWGDFGTTGWGAITTNITGDGVEANAKGDASFSFDTNIGVSALGEISIPVTISFDGGVELGYELPDPKVIKIAPKNKMQTTVTLNRNAKVTYGGYVGGGVSAGIGVTIRVGGTKTKNVKLSNLNIGLLAGDDKAGLL